MRKRQRIIRRTIRRLGFEPTREQIRSVDRAWNRRTFWIQLGSFFGFLVPVGVVWIWLNFDMLRAGGGSITRVFFNTLLFISFPVMVFVLVQDRIVSALGRKKFYPVLREHGFDVCSGCGYRLSGDDRTATGVDRCPECGMEVNEMILLKPPESETDAAPPSNSTTSNSIPS